MDKIRCYECGKLYDWQEDPFCPKCGAFNRQEKGGSQGAVLRDGLNESNHRGSFLHRELHGEDSQRRRTGLEWTKATFQSRRQAVPQVFLEAGRLWNKPKKQVNPGKILVGVVLAIILLNFITVILSAFL